ESSQTNKKRRLQHSSNADSPLPNIHRPSPEEGEVYHLLCGAHGTPQYSSTASTTPNVPEGLISTILSQSTSGSNSSRAKASLDAAFGRNNFAAIATASPERLMEAIRCGELAKKKPAIIQNLLSNIYAKHGSYSLQFLAADGEGARKTDAE
ncbi:hypothetical protein DFH07DRAFT_756236, partial [Mycena maculata]